MPREIPSLWSELLKPGILSPLAILKSQAEALKEQTNGILVPEIDSEDYASHVKQHTLFIVVPALDGFRYSALQVAHHEERPYPVFILGPGLGHFRDEFNKYVQGGVILHGLHELRANNEEEFIQMLSEMLQNPALVGTLQGLIARVSEI